ncbi:MAG: hypothetical protein ACJAZG_002223, partial [Granulosicoccus sp.]
RDPTRIKYFKNPNSLFSIQQSLFNHLSLAIRIKGRYPDNLNDPDHSGFIPLCYIQNDVFQLMFSG